MAEAALNPQMQLMVDSVLPQDFFDVDLNLRRKPPQTGNSRTAPSRLKWVPRNKPILSGKDFILPELVSHTSNGDLAISLSSTTDGLLRDQIFRLAEKSEMQLPLFSELSYAEQQLERRRYSDHLKHVPKDTAQRRTRGEELETWRCSGPEAEANFQSWWEAKQVRKQSGLKRKANRLANCGATGRRLDCSEHPDHRFFAEFACETRYCRRCGPNIFGALFGRYVGLWPTIRELLPPPGFRSSVVVAQLDFTAVNLGRMPTAAEIREFNQDIRACLRQVLCHLDIGSDQCGFLWCDEFGGWDPKKASYNTNLHAHGVYVGPYIPRDTLVNQWTQVRAKKDGAWRLWIQRQKIDKPSQDLLEDERRRFVRALGHALKYTGKHVGRSDGIRLADLEIAFHGVRRVHTMGRFYHADLQCHSKCDCCEAQCELTNGHQGGHQCSSHGRENHCPLCCGHLMFPADSGYVSLVVLKDEGRQSLAEVRRKVARDQVSQGPRGPGVEVRVA